MFKKTVRESRIVTPERTQYNYSHNLCFFLIKLTNISSENNFLFLNYSQHLFINNIFTIFQMEIFSHHYLLRSTRLVVISKKIKIFYQIDVN